jgi:hypothetical protein
VTLAAYEQYRKVLADDPLHQRNADELTRSSAVINVERSIIERCSDEKEQWRMSMVVIICLGASASPQDRLRQTRVENVRFEEIRG